MKFGLILCGLLFFANPNIGIIDILPDVIGVLLILKAISFPSLLIPQFRDAEKGFIRLLCIEILKLIALPLLAKNLNTMPLLLAFSFGIVELIFLIPATGKLFEGIFYMGMRYGGNAIFAYKEKNRVTTNPSTGEREYSAVKIERGPKVQAATIVFIVARTILSVIPVISDLQLFEKTGEVTEQSIALSSFNNLFTVAECAVCIIFAAVWLIMLVPYFRAIIKDKELAKAFSDVKEEKLMNERVLTGWNMRLVTIYTGIVFVAFNTIPIDGVNIFPSIIPAIFCIIAALRLRHYYKKSLAVIPFAVIAGIVSVFTFISQYRYYRIAGNTAEAALWRDKAAALYLPIEIFTVVENVLILASVIILMLSIVSKWRADTSREASQETHDRFMKEARSSVSVRAVLFIIFTVVVSGMWIAQPFVILIFDYFTSIALISTILWTLFSLLFITDLYKNPYNDYLDI